MPSVQHHRFLQTPAGSSASTKTGLRFPVGVPLDPNQQGAPSTIFPMFLGDAHLGGEAGGTSAHAPGHHGLGDAALLLRLNEVVLIGAAHLAQEQQHLGLEPGPSDSGIHVTVHGRNPIRTTWKQWLKPLFVGICKGIIILGFLRWFETDFFHPQYDFMTFKDSLWYHRYRLGEKTNSSNNNTNRSGSTSSIALGSSWYRRKWSRNRLPG